MKEMSSCLYHFECIAICRMQRTWWPVISQSSPSGPWELKTRDLVYWSGQLWLWLWHRTGLPQRWWPEWVLAGVWMAPNGPKFPLSLTYYMLTTLVSLKKRQPRKQLDTARVLWTSPHKRRANISMVNKASHNIINTDHWEENALLLWVLNRIVFQHSRVLSISSLRYSGDMEWYY